MLKLVTHTTKSGNPRQLYVLLGKYGQYVKIWDIGYYGVNALPEEYRELGSKAAYIEITINFYNQLKKMKL